MNAATVSAGRAARDLLRRMVVRTNPYWPFSAMNRVPYRIAIATVARRMKRLGSVRALFLRNSLTRAGWEPGLSDIDLTLVIERAASAQEDYTRVQAVRSEYRRLKQLFPMLGELDVQSASTLPASSRLGMAGYETRFWRPAFGESVATLGFRPSEQRLRFDACSHALFFCLDIVQQRTIAGDGASFLGSRELRRIATKVLAYSALGRGHERLGTLPAVGATPAELAALALTHLDTAVWSLDMTALWADSPAGVACEIEGAQAELPYVEDASSRWPPPVAGIATIVASHRVGIVIVDDGLGGDAMRACFEWTALAFASRDRPVKVVTPAVLTHWIRHVEPYLYTELIRYGRVVWGRSLRLPAAPPERSFAHSVFAQAHNAISAARSAELIGPSAARFIAGREFELAVERAAQLKLLLARGSVAPWHEVLAAAARRRYDALFAQVDAIRERAGREDDGAALAAFELLRTLGEDIADGIERARVDTLLFQHGDARTTSAPGAAPLTVRPRPAVADADVSDRDWDWPGAMREVASRFRGEEGVVLQLGDSLTLAAPNQRWAIRGIGHTEAERAFLEWAHAGTNGERDGWHLASTTIGPPDAPPRAQTASVGCSSLNLLTGRSGRTPLSQLIAAFKPQIVVYAVGTSDILRDTPCEDYIVDVAEAIDLLVAHGTVPILSTLTPMRGRDARIGEFNGALRALARTRCLPLLDIHAEMARRSPDVLYYLQEDGIHLTWDPPNGPATPENLLRSGYLLRCYLTVHKAMDVRERVLMPIASQRANGGTQ